MLRVQVLGICGRHSICSRPAGFHARKEMSAGIATLSRHRTAPSNSQSAGMSHSSTGTPDRASGNCARFMRTPHTEDASGGAAAEPGGGAAASWAAMRTSDDAQ